MKIPLKPPALKQILAERGADSLSLAFNADIGPVDAKGRYLHWDRVRHLRLPPPYDPELYWLATKLARQKLSRPLPLLDKQGEVFRYAMTDGLLRDILWVGENATGVIMADPRVTDDQTRQTYLINSLIEEAISSSQLEGAATTRRVAKEMIRTGRAPRDHSESMILNNYSAIRFIRELKGEDLTPSMVFELHRILTEGTLPEEDRGKAGAFRDERDDICVYSRDDVLLHIPPHPRELPERLQRLCDFANKRGEDDGLYIPPLLRAIIVHFMIGYDHPFVDGNGRVARALFYWLMAREGYWMMEFISLSRVIKKAPAQYLYAYLHTETDDNDVTYFIVHQLGAIKQAIRDLHDYLSNKSQQLREAEAVLEQSPLRGALNFRQLSLLRNALKHPGAEYTIRSHQTSHGVVYQTARSDLLALADQFGLLKRYKMGKKDVFVAPPDLLERIARR